MSTASIAATSPFDRLPDELIEAIARCVIARDWDEKRDRVKSYRRYCSTMTCLTKRWNRIVSPLLWRSISIQPPGSIGRADLSEIGNMLNDHAADIRKVRVVCVDPTRRQTNWLFDLFDVARDVAFTGLSIYYEDLDSSDPASGSEDSYETYERVKRLANFIAGEVEDLFCYFTCWYGYSRPDLCYLLVENLIRSMPGLRRLTVKMDRDWPQDDHVDDENDDDDEDLTAYRSLIECAKALRPELEYLTVEGAKAWQTKGEKNRA